jgi:hypothetical protein
LDVGADAAIAIAIVVLGIVVFLGIVVILGKVGGCESTRSPARERDSLLAPGRRLGRPDQR